MTIRAQEVNTPHPETPGSALFRLQLAGVAIDWEGDYRLVADHIFDTLNPSGDDIAEPAILCNAVSAITNYVRCLPCTCVPVPADLWELPCERCRVLGLAAGRRVER